MDLHLRGRSAVVTGASKGIGLAITRALADEGVSVVAGALRGSDELDELAASADVRSVRVDLTTTDGPGELVAAAATELGGIDVLVNNVGAVRPRLEGFVALTDEDWEWALTINFLAAVRTMRAAIPHMTGRPGASIVTISLGQRLPARPRCHRLQRRQGRAHQPLQVAVQGARPGYPGQHDQSRPGADRPVARQRRSRRDRRRSQRHRPRTSSYAGRRPRRRPAASPTRTRSPTSCSSWPAIGRRTPPAATSSIDGGPDHHLVAAGSDRVESCRTLVLVRQMLQPLLR